MINTAKRIFIVGIKGVAMANIATVLVKMGKKVTGSDLGETFITDAVLKRNQIKVVEGFDSEDLPDNTDLVVYSAAHGGRQNPQVSKAKQRNIKVISQVQLIDQIMQQFSIKIAVCGTHGKTTTSSLLAYALKKLNQRPSYIIGSPYFDRYLGGEIDAKKYFVVEADEYGVNPPLDKTPKFHLLHPDYVVVTNIDFDHPDVYTDLESVKKSFFRFFSNLKKNKTLIACSDSQNLDSVLKILPQKAYETYGHLASSDLVISDENVNEKGSTFNLSYRQNDLGRFSISLYGRHNISNSAAVVLTLLKLGFEAEKIKPAVEDFKDVKRRFEKKYSQNDTYIFDDYGHHPSEISATIQAARSRFSKKRIVVIFQPHTFSRTKILLVEFAQSLSQADQTFILPIFSSARENREDFRVTSTDIETAAQRLHLYNLQAVSSISTLMSKLKKFLKPRDIIITLGAGDVYKLKDDIIKVIKSI